MSYGLGVDLGTTFTAAAVARNGRVEMATLGDHTDAVPSVVLIRDDDTVLTGGAAERRAMAEPDRVARAVKRRFGDPMPVILGGAPYPATALVAYQLRDVVNAVSDREGGRPEMVTLTHPANWGPYKRELFAQVPGLAGLGEVSMLTEPEAAAAHYARNDRLTPGALIAVYDLGGGTFDATVLRTTERGFDILGRPEGIEGLGGVDFDEAVFMHVDHSLDGAVSRLDPSDPRALSAVIRLRNECVTAKEALSADTETSIPVLLPELQTEVRLTRGEFERMIRPAIGATIASLRRALQSAEIDPSQLRTVLLVGGSSRIPMVGHLVSAELGCPTSVDTHPKHAVALGAAAVGAEKAGPGRAPEKAGAGGAGGAAGAGAAGAGAGAAGAVAATELDHPIPPTADITPPTADTTPPADDKTPPTAGKAALAGGFAAVPLIGAGAAPPELKDQGDGRFGKLRARRGHGASNQTPGGDDHSGPDRQQPSDDPSPDRPGRSRVPMMAGVLVLVAALAGGGTVAFRALSNSTPGNTQPLHPVSHTSSSTPSSSGRSRGTTGSGHHASAKTGGASGRSTTTPVTPTAVPATTPVTPRTTHPHTTSPTWTPPAKTSPTWTPPAKTSPTWTPPTTTAPTTAPPTTPAITPSTQGSTP